MFIPYHFGIRAKSRSFRLPFTKLLSPPNFHKTLVPLINSTSCQKKSQNSLRRNSDTPLFYSSSPLTEHDSCRRHQLLNTDSSSPSSPQPPNDEGSSVANPQPRSLPSWLSLDAHMLGPRSPPWPVESRRSTLDRVKFFPTRGNDGDI